MVHGNLARRSIIARRYSPGSAPLSLSLPSAGSQRCHVHWTCLACPWPGRIEGGNTGHEVLREAEARVGVCPCSSLQSPKKAPGPERDCQTFPAELLRSSTNPRLSSRSFPHPHSMWRFVAKSQCRKQGRLCTIVDRRGETTAFYEVDRDPSVLMQSDCRVSWLRGKGMLFPTPHGAYFYRLPVIQVEGIWPSYLEENGKVSVE